MNVAITVGPYHDIIQSKHLFNTHLWPVPIAACRFVDYVIKMREFVKDSKEVKNESPYRLLQQVRLPAEGGRPRGLDSKEIPDRRRL